MKILSDTGNELNANFDLTRSADGFDILWESRGGSDHGPRPSRNKDYAPALELLFRRLGSMGARLDEIQVASSVALKLPTDERRLVLDEFPYPVELSRLADVSAFRLAIGRASAAFRRTGETGGNPTKKLLIRVGWRPEHDALAELEDGLLIVREGTDPNEGWTLKYDKLGEHLRAQTAAEVRLTFQQIESLVGSLPRSAYSHQFWANASRHHVSRRRQWIDAGYDAFYEPALPGVRFKKPHRPIVLEYEAATDDPEELQQRADRVRQRLKAASHAGVSLDPPSGSQAPTQVQASIKRFSRDPNVVAWILMNAVGHCEVCNKPAPFERTDGTPFLEVHHVRPLSEGGPDTVDNAIACCPNCHREMHQGSESSALRDAAIQKIDRLKDYPACILARETA